MLSRSCSRDPIDNRQNNAAGLNVISFYRLVLHIRVDVSCFVFVVKIHPRKDGGNHTWEGNCRTRLYVRRIFGIKTEKGGARYEWNI